MKVLFVKNKVGRDDTAFPSRVEDEMGIYPPLGLCHMAAVARKAGHEVKILDAAALDIPRARLVEEIAAWRPDLAGFSLWTYSFRADMKLLGEIRAALPGVKFIVGGPHLDLYAPETMEAHPLLDFAVIGEGEATFGELLGALEKGGDVTSVQGLAFRKDGVPVINPLRPMIKDLDSLPYPAVDLLPLDNYYMIMARNSRAVNVITTRGCPFKCAYCVDQQFGRSVRYHSAEYVIGYLRWLVYDLGVKEIHFYDDTFTLHKKRVLEFCSRLTADEKLAKTPWTIRTRVDTIDEAMVDALWNSGCYRIGFGVESGNQGILDKMERGTTLDQIRRAFALTRKHPFEVTANFMIGYLDESRATYQDTLGFALELDPDFVAFSTTRVEPNTPLYDETRERGLISANDWRDYVLGKTPRVQKLNFLKGADYGIEDLKSMETWAYVRFYFRPSYIWRQIKRVRNASMFQKKFKMAWAMIEDYFVSLYERLFRAA